MDKALKQRMVGASVIIALIVIVLPMLLSGRPESSSPQSQQIELPPRPESLTFETRRFPVDEAQSQAANSGAPGETAPAVAADRNTPTAVASPAEAEQSADQAQRQESGAEPVPAITADTEKIETAETTEAAKSAAPEEPAPAAAIEQPGTVASREIASAKPESVDVSAAPPTTGGQFLVQVASLGSAENATRLMTNLQQKGYPVLLDTVESEVGKLNRVRVGPYKSEAEAAAIVGKIDEAFPDLNPKVIDLQPQPATPVAGKQDSLARWVVQAGSFSEAVNADRLVAQLRGDGMDAYQEKVTSGASPVYRVRIGPFLEREAATAAQQALAAKRSINGVVVSAN